MLPKLAQNTKTGIHQSDVIIKAGIIAAIQDLRANPWLLESVFADLPQDELTAATYGKKEADNAIRWFLRTRIPVIMDYRLEDHPGTCISISLVGSDEVENTLADVHSVPVETTESEWPVLAGPFGATYEASTGVVTPIAMPDLVVVPDHLLVDRSGNEFVITDVTETGFVIATGSQPDLGRCYIKGSRPVMSTSLESVDFRESYRIGVHVAGEPFHLSWLHSIVIFVLLRYRQEMFEKRGLERTSISSAPFAKNEMWGTNNMWSRFISLVGYIRNVWPKLADQTLDSADTGFRVAPSGKSYQTFDEDNGSGIEFMSGIGVDINS